MITPIVREGKEKVKIRSKTQKKAPVQKRVQAEAVASYSDEPMPVVVLGKRSIEDPSLEDVVSTKRQVSFEGSVVYPKPPQVQ